MAFVYVYLNLFFGASKRKQQTKLQSGIQLRENIFRVFILFYVFN